ncbi:hypothetical protein SLS62_009669 [Diatrype stigma]|uniref:Protein kinase domain-containing protein n=1 Tax=Diatrype stigma TaxID=117547 RepID=A0AAN9ULS6_9PEZI
MEPYRSYWKGNWDNIIRRWGATPPSEEMIRQYWEQEPAPGETLAPLMVSREIYIEAKQKWTSKFGAPDAFLALFGGETKIAHSSVSSAPYNGGDYAEPPLIGLSWNQILQLYPNLAGGQNIQFTETYRKAISAVYAVQHGQQLEIDGFQINAGIVNRPASSETVNSAVPETTFSDSKGGQEIDRMGMYTDPTLGPGEYHKTWQDAAGNLCEVFRMREEKVAQLSDLVRKMLRYDPKERIDTGTALKHEFFERDIEQDQAIAPKSDKDHPENESSGGGASKGAARTVATDADDGRAEGARKRLRRSARLAKGERVEESTDKS